MANVPELEEQAVLRTDSCTDTVEEAPAHPRRRVFTVAAGGAAALVLACGALWATFASAGPSHLSARELLESPEMADIVADNVVALGRHDPSQKGAIREAVGKSLQKKMANLRKQDRATYDRLSNLELPELEKNRFLSQLRRKGDKRLYRIRDEVMAAIKKTVDESGDHEALQRHLAENLQPHVSEMRDLNDAYFPDHQKIPKEIVLQPDHFARMRLVRTFDEMHAKLKLPVARKLLYGSTSADASSDGAGMFEDFENEVNEAMNSMFGDGSMDSILQNLGISSTYNPASNDPMQCAMSAMFGSTDPDTCMDAAVQSMNLDPSLLETFGITTTQPSAIAQVQNLIR